jgi:hypothetical protein
LLFFGVPVCEAWNERLNYGRRTTKLGERCQLKTINAAVTAAYFGEEFL